MLISPFTPLYFNLSSVGKTGVNNPHAQIFAGTDNILIQLLLEKDEAMPEVNIYDSCTGELVRAMTPERFEMESASVGILSLSGLPDGLFYLVIGESESNIFRITSDESVISDTVLISYSPLDNTVRDDVLAIADGKRVVFSFRAVGGFKDSGWNFLSDTEQFTTQRADIVELYSLSYQEKTLTIGDSAGVPVWYGELLNRFLTCHYFYIDGQRYARSGTAVPEMEQTLDDCNSFVFSQTLREIKHIKPKLTDL